MGKSIYHNRTGLNKKQQTWLLPNNQRILLRNLDFLSLPKKKRVASTETIPRKETSVTIRAPHKESTSCSQRKRKRRFKTRRDFFSVVFGYSWQLPGFSDQVPGDSSRDVLLIPIVRSHQKPLKGSNHRSQKELPGMFLFKGIVNCNDQ